MLVLIGFIALALVGVIGVFSSNLFDLFSTSQSQSQSQLEYAIETDYQSRFYQVDSNTGFDFLGYMNLQDYCRDKSIACYDVNGNWTWRIALSDNGLYSYRDIFVYDGRGRLLFSVSGQKYWNDYLKRLDKTIGSICTDLYNYNKNMSERTGYDLNWYARTEGSCYYDGGVNQITYKSQNITVSKQIKCSNGWADADRIWLDRVITGVIVFETGKLQVNNVNSIYSNECAGNGLTGTTPPYAVALRVLLNQNRYYQVCCGF